MDEMPSSEFRKSYAKLTDRTAVTVNGHIIGTWVPVNAPVYRTDTVTPHADEDVVDYQLGTVEQQGIAADRLARGEAGITLVSDTFNTRPFTPVPKHG